MTINSPYIRSTPEHPLPAAQQKARRYGYCITSLTRFPGYDGTPEATLGYVLIFDQMGVKMAEPMSVTDADAWLAAASYERMMGRKMRPAPNQQLRAGGAS